MPALPATRSSSRPTDLFVRCWAVLDAPLRRSWLWITPLSIAGALLDIVTAALLLRMVMLTAGGTPPAGVLARWLDGTPGTPAGLLAVLCAVIILKSALRLGETYWREALSERTVAALARHTLDRWLRAPLRAHLATSMPVIVEDIQSSAGTVGRDGIASALLILSEGLVVAGLSVTMVLAMPLPATGMLMLLGGLAGIILRLAHRRHAHWGEELTTARPALLGFLQSVIAGIREIRISGAVNAFLGRFDRIHAALDRPQVHLNTWRQAPLFLLEALFLIGACLLLLLFKNETGLPLLVVALYAAMRVLPSVNRIIYRVFALQNSLAAAEKLVGDTTQGTTAAGRSGAKPPSFVRELRLDRVGFTYPGCDEPALIDASLVVQAGVRLAIVGPSGHGKSTLLLMMAGLLGADRGAITVDGEPLGPDDERWHRLIGFVSQDAPMLDDTLAANIALGVPPDKVDREALAFAINAARLDGVVARLPQGLDTSLGINGRSLSGGERQRVALARALYCKPRLLLLDEATAFVDPPTEQAILANLAALTPPPAVVFVTHRLSAARQAERIVFFKNGRIEAAGVYEELLAAHPGFAAFVTEVAR